MGTLTGRGRELADAMKRRKIGVLCVQETRWKGNKSREIGEGCKLIYSGANEQGRNGVGIILDKEWREGLVYVGRRSDRIMSVKLSVGELALNVICAYAPQVGCSAEEKDYFWQQLDMEIQAIPQEERVFLGGDLNGHIGAERRFNHRVHGGWGMGELNEEGERFIDCASANDMAIVNTFFQKDIHQYITYKSGGRESQIDFLVCRRNHLREVQNCKVFKGEGVSAQHRIVVMDCEMKTTRKGKKICIPKIKWWELKNEQRRLEFKEKVMREITSKEDPNEWWEENSKVVRRVAEEVLGKTSGKGKPLGKDTWWWSEEVQVKIKEKKEARRRFEISGREEDRAAAKLANKEAKKAVAQAKARETGKIYEELETAEGQKGIYRLAKSRNRATKDLTQIKQMKNAEGFVLREESEIRNRWKVYFEKLLNEENERRYIEEGTENERETPAIEKQEVQLALRRMKNGKASGPDEIPAEAWKSLGDEGINLLWELFRKIYDKEKMPNAWRESVIIPIYKEKGDIQDCGNYRGIKLMSHTMKIWERVIESRIRNETEIGEQQFGFMPGRGTTDAIFAVRQMMEKYGEKQKELHLVFIDLEKAYDRVPRGEVWRCLRERNVAEKYVRLVQDMYEAAKTQVKSSVGMTEKFNVAVGLHQGSSLSPYIFDLIMDVLGQNIIAPAPWDMLFADDIVLIDTTREGVEGRLETWRKAIEDRGLKVSRTKTEYMVFNGQDGIDDISLQGVSLEKVTTFKYLGSHLSSDRNLDSEINHRIQSGWRNWKNVSGVLCDKRISARVKGKVYKTVVRPAMIYGAEAWPIKKTQEKKLDVAEMRMLRWMCGVTKMDRIRNERIRGTTKVVESSKKVQERRLQWYGHIKRRDEQYLGNRISDMTVEGRRARGRPRRRWRDCIGEDLRGKQIDAESAVYENRDQWKRLTRNSDPV